VLIIAHPDDESMFFLPTLHNLLNDKDKKCNIFILCLSNGNYDNLGAIREKELHLAAKVISLYSTSSTSDSDNNVTNRIKVSIVNDERMQDGPETSWDPIVIDQCIQDFMSAKNLDNQSVTLMTFDEVGVSGHINHVHTNRGVLHYYQGCKDFHGPDNKMILWTLKTIHNPIVKYVPLVLLLQIVWDWMFMFFMRSDERCKGFNENCTSYRMIHPSLVWNAMKVHESQFVWYRRLFVVFSSYSYTNDFVIHERGMMRRKLEDSPRDKKHD